jgi:hypothetical protein
MMRGTMIGAAIALWGSSPLAAQPVFFDDFDGPDLLPHWRTPPPQNWDYNVSGGRLNVTDLHFPGIAHLESNYSTIRTSFDPQGDFRIDVWMGWQHEPSTRYDELALTVTNAAGGHMASFGLRYPGGPPLVRASATSAGSVSISPPSPGIHQFTIAREGAIFDFYLDGEHFGSLPDHGEVDPVAGMQIFFSKPFPGDMNPKYIERVLVVPAPAVLTLSIPCALLAARRRR